MDDESLHLKNKMLDLSLGYAEAEKNLAETLLCPVCTKELEEHPLRKARSCFVHGDYVIKYKIDKYIVVWNPLRFATAEIEYHHGGKVVKWKPTGEEE